MNQYFEDRLSISRVQNGTSSAESARIINLLEAARLADPNHIAKYHAAFQADKSDKGSLTVHKNLLLGRARRFGFVVEGVSTMPRLVSEESLWNQYATYLGLAYASVALENGEEILNWWAKNGKQIPAWSMFARSVFSLQPSSAVTERVFSLLRYAIDSHQQSALSDLLETTCMRRYNHRKAKPFKAGTFADFETNVCEHDSDEE